MNDALHPALLPQGTRDLLPPEAEAEAEAVSRLMAVLASHGYERVKPPLIEFEENLLAGAGAAMARDTFRLMDPISQRMIGVRADMTPQVARIAIHRLGGAPRPLRLCYAGQVLRVRGSELRPARQVGEVGAELIGSDAVAADVEAIAVEAEALQHLGIAHLSVDLGLPRLIAEVASAHGLDAATAEAFRVALDHKDAGMVAAVGGPAAPVMGRLLAAAGPARKAMAALVGLELPPAAAAERTRLGEVVAALARGTPELQITVDPVENRGFEYHTGITFNLLARGVAGELGRGGRYRTGAGGGEEATGFTLYTDTIVGAMPAPALPRRVYLPAGADPALGARLRQSGWVTVAGLDAAGDGAAEARRLGCSHVAEGDKIVTLSGAAE